MLLYADRGLPPLFFSSTINHRHCYLSPLLPSDPRTSRMKLQTVLFVSVTAVTIAFVPHASFGITRRRTSLLQFAASSSDDYEKPLARNKARTDVRNFLTQRSLQSFIFLLLETRDPHTVTWMEEFGGWKVSLILG